MPAFLQNFQVALYCSKKGLLIDIMVTRSQIAAAQRRFDKEDAKYRIQDAIIEYKSMQQLEQKVNVVHLCNKHKIKRATFQRMLKKGITRVENMPKAGRPFDLSYMEECMLSTWVISNQAIGMSVTREQIRRKAADLGRPANDDSSTDMIKTNDWLRAFLKRHPYLSGRSSSSLDRSKAQFANPITVKNFYSLLKTLVDRKSVVTAENVKITPVIFNMDESMIDIVSLMERRRLVVIGLRGTRNAYNPIEKKQDHVTILESVGSNGMVIPPLVIFKGKMEVPGLLEKCPPGSKIEYSPNGWTNEEICCIWMRHFVEHTAHIENRILLLDGHASHYAYDAIDLAKKNNISVLTFPSNCTHVLQPLDVGVFNNFKQKMKTQLGQLLVTRTDLNLSQARTCKETICDLIKLAHTECMVPNVILHAFRETGIAPLDEKRLLDSGKLSPSLASSVNADSATIVVASFCKKYRDQVKKVLETAKMGVSSPTMGIFVELSDIQTCHDRIAIEDATPPIDLTASSSSSSSPAPVATTTITRKVEKNKHLDLLNSFVEKHAKRGSQEYTELQLALTHVRAKSTLQIVRSIPPPSKRQKPSTGKLSGKAEILTDDAWMDKANEMEKEQEAKTPSKRKSEVKEDGGPQKKSKTVVSSKQSAAMDSSFSSTQPTATPSTGISTSSTISNKVRIKFKPTKQATKS